MLILCILVHFMIQLDLPLLIALRLFATLRFTLRSRKLEVGFRVLIPFISFCFCPYHGLMSPPGNKEFDLLYAILPT